MGFSTKNWVIGILVASWIATFIVGFLHGVSSFLTSEPENPIVHTFRDWIILIPITLIISYIIARLVPSK